MSRIIASPTIGEDVQNALQDAFLALRLSSPLPSQSQAGPQNSPLKELEDSLVIRRRHSEWIQSSETAQPPPLASERRSTLPELWADPNALYTMTCLEGQFVKVLGLNPSRLTITDFEQLYKAKFRELNEEIIGDSLGFVEAMQVYERDCQEHQERMRRLRMQHQQHMEMCEHLRQQRQSQDLFDPQYSTVPVDGTYIYSSSGSLDPPVIEPLGKSAPLKRIDSDYSSMRSHRQIRWSPVKLAALETTQQETPTARSSSWSSPVHYSPIGMEGYSRPRGSSHADYSQQVTGDPALVYYSTPPHGSTPSLTTEEPHIQSYQMVGPAASSIHLG